MKLFIALLLAAGLVALILRARRRAETRRELILEILRAYPHGMIGTTIADVLRERGHHPIGTIYPDLVRLRAEGLIRADPPDDATSSGARRWRLVPRNTVC